MKNRLITLIFLLLATAFTAEANPVDMSTAREVAVKFVNANTKTHLRSIDELQLVTTYSISRGDAAFHIFNTPNGFVIVSADDCATPILGYSDEGRPFDMDNIPIQLQDVLQEYVEQIQYAVENHLVADEETAEQWRLVQSTGRLSNNRDNIQVGPLLTTTWDQGQFYNAMCPEDPDGLDGHALTGCVATAMAQIINYWEYPTHGRGSHSFNVSNLDPGSMPGTNTTGYGTLSVDFEAATYDYNQMPDELDSESTQEEINAVALLMYHCGVAVNMFYGPSSSGAYEEDARSALISYFGYAPSLGYAQRQMYTESEWNDTLKANIDRGEPVLYFGKNAFGAHAFVLDGYDQSNYYHFNFGWSGDCDGWFLTKAINVSWGFNEWQSAIMGIRPDSNSHAIICHRIMYVQNNDHFSVTEPVDLYPMRGGSEYLATNEMTGVRIDLNLVPEDSLGQLVLDVLDFGMEQSVVIYDGINKDSLVRVIETRSFNVYEGLPEDSIFQNMAGTDFSPIVSSRHGFTVLVYSYGGTPESFRLQVRNSTDINPNNPSFNDNVYWTDVVTSEPDGYLLDGDTIRITSAEGLAWVSRYLDSIWLEEEVYQYYHHFISIENDLNLAGYLWKPIRSWQGDIEGNGHVIQNMKVSTSYYGGLFSEFYNAVISDIGMINAKVNSINSAGTIAGIVQNSTLSNIYSINHNISIGNGLVGGLVGDLGNSHIINCYAYGDISAQFGYGGLVGYISNSEINNCVTQLGETFNWFYQYDHGLGLITEEVHGGTFSNCFSDISIAKRMWTSQSPEYDYLAKRAYFLGNVYNVDEIDNLVAFNIAVDSTGMLLADTAVNYSLGENMDVITALNNKVAEYNSPDLRTWVMDNETNMPVFGVFFEVTCPNVSEIVAENIVYNDGFAVALSWQENGDAEEWQVKYNIRNSPEDSAVVVTTNATQDTLQGLQLGNEYVFYVRPVCGDDTVGWGMPFTFFVDKPLWIDMVTSCPEGYYEDSNGNVTISSPEGLAWLAKIGFNYRQDTIFIANDLDMGAYKWTPIGRDSFQGTVEGYNHIISNIYCNDDMTNLYSTGTGLFAQANNASFKNIVIQNSSFSGNRFVGALIGCLLGNGTVVNCHVTDVVVKGLEDVGGLGGLFTQCNIYNCSSSGIVYGDYNEGGLIGNHNGTIINCYSSCNINPLGYKDRMWYGGLLGVASGTVSNCYSFGNVEMDANDPFYTWGVYYGGTSIGRLYNVNVTHTYAQHSGLMPLAARIEDVVSLSDTASLVNNTLQTPVTIAGTSYIDLLDALNAWVDTYDTLVVYRHWVADTAMVNDGFPMFEELPAFEIDATASPTEGGMVEGAGTYQQGQLCILIATPNEGYTFINWTKNGEEVSTEAAYSFTVTENAYYMANFEESAITQTTNFTNGWNWWSSYVELGDNSLTQLQEGLGASGEQIKSQNEGYASYLEGFGWYGSLAELHNEQSYRVKFNAPCTVPLQGVPTNPAEHPISIVPGWTWIGFPWSQSISIETALEGFEAETNDIIKGQNAYTMYYAENGYSLWFGPLHSFEPGRGYVYCSNSGETKTLTYHADGSKGHPKPNPTTENNHWQPNLNAYPDNMTVMAVVELDGEELQGEQYELAAFANGEVRGSARLMYVEPLNRYMAFLTIAGDEAVELYFGLYNAESGAVEMQSIASLQYETNAIVGSFAEPYVVSFRGDMGMDEWLSIIQLYPNPVERGQTLTLGLEAKEIVEAQVEIINALGFVVKTQRITSQTTIKAPETVGVYTLRITTEGKETYYSRLIVR